MRGEEHHCAQLTEPLVRAIRRLHYVKGVKCDCLAKLYDLSYTTVWDCVNYNTWKHVRDTFVAAQIKPTACRPRGGRSGRMAATGN